MLAEFRSVSMTSVNADNEWLYVDGAKEQNRVPFHRVLINGVEVSGATPVWKAGMAGWKIMAAVTY
jgi:hypothetical protein